MPSLLPTFDVLEKVIASWFFAGALCCLGVGYVPRTSRTYRWLAGYLVVATAWFFLFDSLRAAARSGGWALDAKDATRNIGLALTGIAGLFDAPVKPVNIGGALLVRAVGAMADSDAILFFSLAFSATVLQGYAHFFTRQKAPRPRRKTPRRRRG